MKFVDYKAAGNEAGCKAAGQYRYALAGAPLEGGRVYSCLLQDSIKKLNFRVGRKN